MEQILVFLFLVIVGVSQPEKVDVVLLPEEDGKVGKIEIEKDGKTTIVDKPYQKVNIIQGSSEILTKESVTKKYKTQLEALPSQPKSFLLYFEWDSTNIVESSKNEFGNILEKIEENKPTYIDVIGHTDTAGDSAYNKKLSLQRAQSIVESLIQNGVSKEIISINYYGEAIPIVKTKDGVANSKNRRVEVILK
jgi:outer membrane protein OmpA-like peptidoglycan-associated protein